MQELEGLLEALLLFGLLLRSRERARPLAQASPPASDEVRHIGGHLVHFGVVDALDLAHGTDVVGGEEVDRDTLAAEAAGAADAVDVVGVVRRQVVVDDERDLRQRGGRRAEAGWVQSCG